MEQLIWDKAMENPLADTVRRFLKCAAHLPLIAGTSFHHAIAQWNARLESQRNK